MCLKTFVSKPYPLQNLLKQRMKTYKIVVILHLNGKKTYSKASDGEKNVDFTFEKYVVILILQVLLEQSCRTGNPEIESKYLKLIFQDQETINSVSCT
jgi:hypothetical protein